MNTFLIVGLGNPGRKYKETRHNIGFKVIEEISRILAVLLKEKKFKNNFGKGMYEGNKIVLVQPQTFMNLSGTAVYQLMNYFKISPLELVVISDDFALPLGKIRIRKNGSAGGHNGLTSIISEIKTQEFCRVRIGIDVPSENIDPAKYVLEKFSSAEKKEINGAVKKAAEVILFIITDGVEKAMNKFN
jgi:PTH1 family peptidyl-tRNA hydrolase